MIEVHARACMFLTHLVDVYHLSHVKNEHAQYLNYVLHYELSTNQVTQSNKNMYVRYSTGTGLLFQYAHVVPRNSVVDVVVVIFDMRCLLLVVN